MKKAICKKSIDLYKMAMEKEFFKHSYFTLGNFFIFIDNYKAQDNFYKISQALKRCIETNDYNSFNYIVAKGIHESMTKNFCELNVLMTNRINDVYDTYKKNKLKTFNLVFDDFYFLKNIKEIKQMFDETIDKKELILKSDVLSIACVNGVLKQEKDIALFVLKNI